MIDYEAIRKLCIDKARKSDCAKMGFGVVALYIDPNKGAIIVHSDNNRRHPLLSGFCEGDECCRLHIQSRTQSLLGACAHAEERAIWHLLKYRREIKIENVRLFVVGVRPDGTAYQRMGTEWTCIRCAITMNYAKISSINFWNQEDLISIRPNLALQQAVRYATGEKVWEASDQFKHIGSGEAIHIDFPKVDMSKGLRFNQDDPD